MRSDFTQCFWKYLTWELLSKAHFVWKMPHAASCPPRTFKMWYSLFFLCMIITISQTFHSLCQQGVFYFPSCWLVWCINHQSAVYWRIFLRWENWATELPHWTNQSVKNLFEAAGFFLTATVIVKWVPTHFTAIMEHCVYAPNTSLRLFLHSFKRFIPLSARWMRFCCCVNF